MSIQMEEDDGGKLLIVHVTGKLDTSNYAMFVPEFERLIREHGKLRVLFDMTGFCGWEAGALWTGVAFEVKHCTDIERLAMVGDKKWQHGMATFCKLFTSATIRYFDFTEIAEAHDWLEEDLVGSFRNSTKTMQI